MRGTRRLLGMALLGLLASSVVPIVAQPAAADDCKGGNDDRASAVVVSPLPFDWEGCTENATAQDGEPDPSCFDFPDKTVWFRIQQPKTVSLSVETLGSDYDTALAVWREEPDGVTEFACNDEHHNEGGTRSRVQLTVDAGTTYLVQVAAIGGGGRLLLGVRQVSRPPTIAALQPFAVTASDGTVLEGHVYVPSRPGKARVATVVEYSPYWGSGFPSTSDLMVEQGDRATMWGWLAPYFDAGFAVAAVNIRGSGTSGGCIDWGSPLDVDDTRLVIEALADQSWSNGNVGMIGLSYPGWMAMQGVASGSPALKAVVSMSGITDLWSLFTRNGAAHLTSPFQSALTNFSVRLPYAPDDDTGQAACERFLTEDTAEGATLAVPVSGDRTQYWEERDLRSRIADNGKHVAVFATIGIGRRPAGSDAHQTQLDGVWDLLGPDKRFVLGQWGHRIPLRDDFADMAVGWFDEHLRDGPRTVQPGVVEYQDGSAWRTAPSWPPPATVTTLTASGDELGFGPSHLPASAQTFASVDFDPLPFDCPGVKAIYISPKVAEDVYLAGYTTTDLKLTSTAPEGNLAVGLYHLPALRSCAELAPSMRSFGGLLPADGHAMTGEISFGLTDLMHRTPGATGAPFPSEPTEVSVDSVTFGAHIKAGERLFLTVGGGSVELFPNAFKPTLTVSGPVSVSVPVVAGALHFENP